MPVEFLLGRCERLGIVGLPCERLGTAVLHWGRRFALGSGDFSVARGFILNVEGTNWVKTLKKPAKLSDGCSEKYGWVNLALDLPTRPSTSKLRDSHEQINF